MFEGVCSFGFGCSRRTFSVIVCFTCPLYPRDETAYHRWGFRDGVDLVVELWLVRATGNMDLRIQVLGLSYFSIDIVPELLQHTLWGFWASVREEGYTSPFSPVAMPGVPKSDHRPVWRRRRFFLSSVEDSVLERSAALESLCFGKGKYIDIYFSLKITFLRPIYCVSCDDLVGVWSHFIYICTDWLASVDRRTTGTYEHT